MRYLDGRLGRAMTNAELQLGMRRVRGLPETPR